MHIESRIGYRLDGILKLAKENESEENMKDFLCANRTSSWL